MPRFMALYIGSAASRENATPFDPEKGMEAWGEWVTRHADSVVDMGSPLGKPKRASRQGISDITNTVTAYVIVEANNAAAAAKMFENHPHFTIFPGDSVEIMECLPLPGA